MNIGIFGLKSSNLLIKHIVFEDLPWQPVNHYVRNVNISRTFKDVSNSIQNFMFMGTTVSDVAGGPPYLPPRLAKGVGTKKLDKERVNLH